MTQQVKPIMHFNHDTYSIIKESDRDAFRSFFDPKEHGFKPFSTDTSCWAGFKCQYGIIEDNLFITNVEINEYTEFKPRLFNREPIILENWGNGKKCKLYYKNVNHPIAYTGDLFIANNFITGRNRPRYKPSYLNYETILQLTFDHGTLIHIINHSVSLEEVRTYIDNHNDRLPDDLPPISKYFESIW